LSKISRSEQEPRCWRLNQKAADPRFIAAHPIVHLQKALKEPALAGL
jgi:hypothetical protein